MAICCPMGMRSTSLGVIKKFDQDSDGDGFYWFEDCDDDDSLTKPSGIETWAVKIRIVTGV